MVGDISIATAKTYVGIAEKFIGAVAYFFPAWFPSFFSERRTRHYLALNPSVLRPLTRLQLRKVILDTDFIHKDFVFVIDILPVDTSRTYQLALRHMDFDNPQLRTAVMDLRERISAHNALRDRLENEISLAIRRRLTTTHMTPLIGDIRYNYRFNDVYRYLSSMWRPTMQAEKTSSDLVEERIKKKEWHRDAACIFYFGGIAIGSGTEHEFASMANGLTNILLDENLLQILSNLEANWNVLQDRITSIREMATPIVDLIDDDIYETRVKSCCPGWL